MRPVPPTLQPLLGQAPLANGLPVPCGGIFDILGERTLAGCRAAARSVPMGLIATSLTGAGNLGRPVVDHTGLSGTFDFSLEWTPEINGPAPADFAPDPSGPTFVESFEGATRIET